MFLCYYIRYLEIMRQQGRTDAIPVLVKKMALKVRLGLDLFAHLSSYEIQTTFESLNVSISIELR